MAGKKSVDITLSPGEIFEGAMIGVMRHCSDLQKGRKQTNAYKRTADWQIDCEGALAEKAVAKYLGRYHTGAHNFRGSDVAGVEVRSSPRDDARLIMHPSDHGDRPYILVTGINGVYKLRGWIMGQDGKDGRYWSDPRGGRPAFFVPRHALEPMSKLLSPPPPEPQE